jgi:hypothetical protein
LWKPPDGDALRVTIVYEDVIDALRGTLELRFGENAGVA